MTESAFKRFLSLEKALGAGVREGENRLPQLKELGITKGIKKKRFILDMGSTARILICFSFSWSGIMV